MIPLAIDSIGLALAAYLIAILALGILAGKALKANRRRYYPRERVGETPWERYERERELAVARGEVHAARARRRRLDAMERERAVYEDAQERAS